MCVCGTDSTSRPVGYPGSDDDSSGAGEGSTDCARAVTAIIGDRQPGRDFFYFYFFAIAHILAHIGATEFQRCCYFWVSTDE